MSARPNVRFEVPPNGVQSPSTSPEFIFDLSKSDDGSSEKTIEQDSPVENRELPNWNAPPNRWNQRPKSMPWSSRPHQLREKRRPRWYRDLVVDSFVIFISFPFFIVAAVVVALNGRQVNDTILSILKQAINGAATLFPIFFAYVTGRAAVKFATWKLEQGSSLGLLEQLMGSRTVASSITTQVHLRKFNLIGLGLIVLWSLSPIGSQAVLYILEAPLSPVISEVNVSYINTRQQSYAAPDGIFKGTWFSGFTMLFGSSLLAPTAVKASSMDLWGNVKIPYYSSVINTTAKPDENGWIQIEASANLSYSSLFGVPLSGIGFGNTTVTIESSYLQLNCTEQSHTNSNHPVDAQGRPVPFNITTKSTLISATGPFLSNDSVNPASAFALGYQGVDAVALAKPSDSSGLVWTYPQSCPDCLGEDLTTPEPGVLLYQEFDSQDNATNVFCTPFQVYVESSVTCEKDDDTQVCKVTAQRLSRLPHNPTSITYLSFREVVFGVSALVPNLSPLADNNPAQRYLYDPFSTDSIIAGASSNLLGDQTPLALENISLSDFGERLGQILNTFIYGSMYNTTAYTIGGSFDGMVDKLVGGNAASFVPASQAEIQEMIQNQTAAFTVPATLEAQIRIYKASFQWIGIFLFATSAMLFSAVGGVIFSRNTVVPDYLGYVSSLAKESPWVRMPDGGANLDGMDRARLMKDLRVRLGNVDEGRGEVGRLAFARMEETGVARKDSFYV
ncbi:hypothetical protein B0O99DRAFT_619841 [Bisporella sp. PMI_857]|nr:hypothetical protein B0O99DRAFT_619841 [Bisporella sp. PMI_857]